MTQNRPIFDEYDFRKASMSEGPRTDCVRVARRGGWVEVRDDKTAFGAPDDHRLVLTAEQFDTFLAGVRAGRPADLPLVITRRSDGTHTVRTPDSATELTFTAAEITAFLAGVRAGEFDARAYAAA